MKILVLFCHPDPASFQATILADLVGRLKDGRHEVTVIDLYGEAFDPILDQESWRAHRQERRVEDGVSAHVAALRDCEGLIFVYPTWWYGLPAMLKGWLDRIWQPGVAFTMEGGIFRLHHLTNVRRFAVVTTHGSPGWFIDRVVGNPGRRQLMRGMALQFARGVRTCWQAIYAVDERPVADLARARDRSVARVARFFDRG